MADWGKARTVGGERIGMVYFVAENYVTRRTISSGANATMWIERD
jgi:hypothetical protein